MLQLNYIPVSGSLVLQDQSVYAGIVNNPRVAISLPNGVAPVQLSFAAGQVNAYTPAQLGSSLPDGLYQIRYATGFDETTSVCLTFYRTALLECKLVNWIREYDWLAEPLDGRAYKKLTRISGLLLGMQAQPDRAAGYYQVALSLLS